MTFIKEPCPKTSHTCLPNWLEKCYAQKCALPVCEDDVRNFLRPNFWSHGTPLGSLGPLSFEALGPGFDQCQILLIWGPHEYLDLAALHGQAKNPKTVGA